MSFSKVSQVGQSPEPRRKTEFRFVGLGPLEALLLESLWRHPGPASVRQVQLDAPGLAYTTVMTTLDRLYRKGILVRQRVARAFSYTPRCTRDELMDEIVSRQVSDLLSASVTSAAVLSTLVRTVASTDLALLEELEVQVRAERVRLGLPDK